MFLLALEQMSGRRAIVAVPNQLATPWIYRFTESVCDTGIESYVIHAISSASAQTRCPARCGAPARPHTDEQIIEHESVYLHGAHFQATLADRPELSIRSSASRRAARYTGRSAGSKRKASASSRAVSSHGRPRVLIEVANAARSSQRGRPGLLATARPLPGVDANSDRRPTRRARPSATLECWVNTDRMADGSMTRIGLAVPVDVTDQASLTRPERL